MKDYKLLLKELKSYLSMEDVAQTNEVISAYDLQAILNSRFERLRYVGKDFETVFDNEHLITIGDKASLNSFEYQLRSCKVKFSADQEKTEIKLTISELLDGPKTRKELSESEETIVKYKEKEKLHFDKTTPNKRLIEKYYYRLMTAFITLEEYSELFSILPALKCDGSIISEIEKHIEQNFTDSFLNFEIDYTTHGNVKTSLSLSKKEDPRGIQMKSTKNRILRETLEENKEAILRKIPIRIDELEPISRRIVAEVLQIEEINLSKKILK